MYNVFEVDVDGGMWGHHGWFIIGISIIGIIDK